MIEYNHELLKEQIYSGLLAIDMERLGFIDCNDIEHCSDCALYFNEAYMFYHFRLDTKEGLMESWKENLKELYPEEFI